MTEGDMIRRDIMNTLKEYGHKVSSDNVRLIFRLHLADRQDRALDILIMENEDKLEK